MMFRKCRAGTGFSRLLSLIVAGTLLAGGNIQAVVKKAYSKPPFTAFSSQMTDGLSGGGKYEKPIGILHDSLNLSNWLESFVEPS